MTADELHFDDHMEMYIALPGLDREVCLIVSDHLLACEEEWTGAYRDQLCNFINAFPVWRPIAEKAVLDYGRQTYGVEATEQDLGLLNIFILFDLHDSPLFGLQYRVEYDVEHGCGVKIRGGDFAVAEIGPADVSFC